MTITGMELPIISDKDELNAKVPKKRITKKARPIGSLSASDSGQDVNPHMPPSIAKFLNSIKQTNMEKPTSNQSRSTPEQPIHPRFTPEQQSLVVKKVIAPAALAAAMGVESKIETSGCRVYLDDLVKDSGNPVDPVEIMLLEQTAMCHIFSMKLQSKASGAEGTEAIELYLSGAARLSSEFRKTALALKEYRKK
jgi:hypothetical protein